MQALQQRIQRLEDIEAIRLLKARYFHACDQKDIDTLRECFAEGPILVDYGAIGRFTDRDAFLALYKEMACHEYVVDMHHGQNAQIDWQSENQASAIWDLFFYQINTQTSTLTQLAGHYQDRFIKQESRWVIAATCFKVTSSVVASMAEGDLKVLFAGRAPTNTAG